MDDSSEPTELEATSGATTVERELPPPRPSSPRLTGDRYQIAERLARGGMGEVMHAYDRQIGREVAIKRMRREAPSQRAIDRFLREATVQGKLDHPSIVPVYELGRDVDGRPYFAMKKLAGTTLASMLAEPRQRLLRAFVDVCLAVEFAHSRGVIHRDLKPENIMLGDFGETYVLDWGVAKVDGASDIVEPSESEESATATGAAIGTGGYMAPEQARGDADIDARVDVYALGCILFDILTGQRLHPRGKDGIAAAVHGFVERPARRAPDRDIPPELDDLCAQALSPRRADRIATARELGDRVQRYLDGDRDLSVRRTIASEHMQTATASFAAGDHPQALREAARAVALDPRLPGAAELITRIMLEPPAHIPPEIEAALDDDGDKVVRRVGKSIALSNLLLLGFVPFLVGRVAPIYVFVLLGLVVMKFAITWGVLRTPLVRYWRLGFNMVFIAFIVRLSSPVLFAPGIAAVTAVGLMSGVFRTVRHGVIVGVGLAVAVIVPWVLEQAGLVSSTMGVENGALAIRSPMLEGAGMMHVGLVTWISLLLASAIFTTYNLRLAERAARRQVRVQAWQLRQLVPA